MNLAGLDRALRALGPYVEDVVLCGAWAWYVHRRCSGAATWLPQELLPATSTSTSSGLAESTLPRSLSVSPGMQGPPSLSQTPLTTAFGPVQSVT